MYYINIVTGRLVSANNRVVTTKLEFVEAQQQTFDFTFLDADGEIVAIPDGATFRLDVNTVPDSSLTPICITSGTVSGNVVSFEVDTYTEEYFARVNTLGFPVYIDLLEKLSGATYHNRLAKLDGVADPRKYIDGQPPTPATYYLSKDETFEALGTAPLLEFSVDGVTDWHETQTTSDRYYRSTPQGIPEAWQEPGEAIELVVGPQGEKGADGATITPPAERTYNHATYGTVCYLDSTNAMPFLGYQSAGWSKIKLWLVTANAAVTGNIVLNVGASRFVVAVGATVAMVELDFATPVTGLITITRNTADAADTLKDGSSTVVTAYVVDWRCY